MENLQLLLVVAAVVAAIFCALAFLFPYLRKRGVNVSGKLASTNTALDTAGVVMNALQGFFPDNAALTVVDRIISWAQKSVAAAEQLYITSEIGADQRKEKATQLVYDCLSMAGYEIDEKLKKIVEGCIEAAVFALPETSETMSTT